MLWAVVVHRLVADYDPTHGKLRRPPKSSGHVGPKRPIKFQTGGFDLDLSYIVPQKIAAAALPGSTSSHSLQSVSDWLKKYHGGNYRYVLCCAVLCCAVLCCVVLCCAVLCCAVLCCAVYRCVLLCCAAAPNAALRLCWVVCTIFVVRRSTRRTSSMPEQWPNSPSKSSVPRLSPCSCTFATTWKRYNSPSPRLLSLSLWFCVCQV